MKIVKYAVLFSLDICFSLNTLFVFYSISINWNQVQFSCTKKAFLEAFFNTFFHAQSVLESCHYTLFLELRKECFFIRLVQFFFSGALPFWPSLMVLSFFQMVFYTPTFYLFPLFPLHSKKPTISQHLISLSQSNNQNSKKKLKWHYI